MERLNLHSLLLLAVKMIKTDARWRSRPNQITNRARALLANQRRKRRYLPLPSLGKKNCHPVSIKNQDGRYGNNGAIGNPGRTSPIMTVGVWHVQPGLTGIREMTTGAKLKIRYGLTESRHGICSNMQINDTRIPWHTPRSQFQRPSRLRALNSGKHGGAQ